MSNNMRVVLSALLALCVTGALGPLVIPALRKLKFGQSILDEGPSWHKSKQGTPTMGGLLFSAGIVVAFGVCAFSFYTAGSVKAALALGLGLVFGLIGFCDDFIKVVKKRNLGLTAWQKIVLQFLAGAGFLILLAARGDFSTAIPIPFTETSLELGFFAYFLALFLIVGMVNAANLTDGIDGLDASVTVPVAGFFLLAASQRGAEDVRVLAAALIGGMIGFLIFNFHPAKVFMGDTGSLFIGGITVGMAFVLDMPYLILLAGLVYLLEALSVILQVIVFKLTHKRIFKMAPIHHHFEMCGWSEVKIVYVFTTVSLVGCVLAYLLSCGLQ